MTAVDDIKSRLDIVDVITPYAPLQRSGRAFRANCPFHQERTPSFYVNQERQSWHCFGACATGGDIFTFIMQAQNIDFSEALQQLAQQAGVNLPRREQREEQNISYQVNEAAADFFQRCLASSFGADARQYLEQRGINRESVAKFQLGLSPPDGQALSNYLQKNQFNLQQIIDAGLTHQNDDGTHRDSFRNRLTIPIRNTQGQLSGFSSRVLDHSEPKYMNTAKTQIFDKSRLLYGLHLAKESARQEGIVIVEGYMDTITAHQHGYTNVVASMGTALTEQQVAEVKRLTDQVTMALDADSAGKQATLRTLETSWQVFQQRLISRSSGTSLLQGQQNPELRIITLPEGKDPDEFIQNHPEQWPDLVSQGQPLFDYLLNSLTTQTDTSHAAGKAHVFSVMVPFVAQARDFQQDQYLKAIAEKLNIREDTLRTEFKQRASQARADRTPPLQRAAPRTGPKNAADNLPTNFANSDADPLEERYLTLLLQFPDLTEPNPTRLIVSPDCFRSPENRAIYSRLVQTNNLQRTDQNQPVNQPMDIAETFPETLQEKVANLYQVKLPPSTRQVRRLELHETANRLEGRYLRDLKQAEKDQFTDDSAHEEHDQLPNRQPEETVLDTNRRLKENQENRGKRNQPPKIPG